MNLPADVTRCHDAGCGERVECRRWLERWMIPDSGTLSHAESLFPYDDIPPGERCPHRIALEDKR